MAVPELGEKPAHERDNSYAPDIITVGKSRDFGKRVHTARAPGGGPNSLASSLVVHMSEVR